MNRRTFLGGAAAVATATPIATIPQDAPPETLEQKRDRLFAELGDTLEAITGTRWNKSNDRKYQVVVLADSYEALPAGGYHAGI
ncbi:hypothetical protein [Rhizobium lentis]|uniref:hypothetical protein n=1 Tax=Rhizobium lentis TaxID=1138194 RepID=UPI001C83E35D|nr:hypothetical protein [Rhizobium lentis]MBX5148069.1 hypothetical protein [Rhizobium lentis]